MALRLVPWIAAVLFGWAVLAALTIEWPKKWPEIPRAERAMMA